MSKFKSQHPFEKRIGEAKRILSKFPDRIPVIAEVKENTNIPDLDKHKFLVPHDLSVGQFIHVLRKRIKLTPEQALFLFINNQLVPTSEIMSVLYQQNKDEDKFLYLLACGETTYG